MRQVVLPKWGEVGDPFKVAGAQGTGGKQGRPFNPPPTPQGPESSDPVLNIPALCKRKVWNEKGADLEEVVAAEVGRRDRNLDVLHFACQHLLTTAHSTDVKVCCRGPWEVQCRPRGNLMSAHRQPGEDKNIRVRTKT